MFYLQLIVAGIATGCIYSLAGMGIVLTYKATGVFNFAHGAVAMIVAYSVWQLDVGWGWPLWLAALVGLGVVAPGLGLLLELVVFGPLDRSGASTSEKLVATLGVFTVLLGVAYAVWTGTERQGPRLVTNRSLQLASGLRIGADQLAIVVIVVVVCAALWFVFRRTHLGVQLRAVVDRRGLAELCSIDANRISGLAWAMGCMLAGLTGVLLAPSGLNPFDLTLLVVETYSIAVVARLTSLPLAVGAGVLFLGVGQSLLTQVHVFGGTGLLGTMVEQIKPNLSVVILFAALLVYRRLDDVRDERGADFRVSRRSEPGRRRGPVLALLIGAALVVLPFFLNFVTIAYGQRMLALIVVFASIVCVTGFSGNITLGQGAFAGFGAFLSARVTNSLHLPVVLAMVVGGAGAMLLGLATGWPAARRRSLFLGLTTLAISLMAYSFVFQSTQFAGGSNGLAVHRPSLFGWSLAGPRAFYWFELVCVGLVLLLARNLRVGRLGRALAAMRDSEVATGSIGIDLRTHKLFIFGASAFMAGIGGALLSQQARLFDPFQFNPLTSSLVWFTVVVVAGVDSIVGAVLGAAVFVLLDVVVGTTGVAQLLIGLAAMSLGRIPGGNLVGLLREAWDRLAATGRRAVAAAHERAGSPPEPTYTLTPLASRLAASRRPVTDTGRPLRGSGPATTRRPGAGSPPRAW